MAMTLRIEKEDKALLEKIARRRGMSRQKTILQLVREEGERLNLHENPFTAIPRISSTLSSHDALNDERKPY
ncbi:MAG: ribbon-helix-helix protein, CopG family [Actinomycetaceae bacterium]|nr:ribbon-helix-helix protein, CopG family [Actinomycetaceae bacterium]